MRLEKKIIISKKEVDTIRELGRTIQNLCDRGNSMDILIDCDVCPLRGICCDCDYDFKQFFEEIMQEIYDNIKIEIEGD